MKKISKINWRNYKESKSGKEAIERFERIYAKDVAFSELIDLIKRYNPQFMSNVSEREILFLVESLQFHGEGIADYLDNTECEFKSIEDFVNFYPSYMFNELAEDGEQTLADVKQSACKMFLSDNMAISMMLYVYLPQFYIPNLFVMQFAFLKRIADKYEIELPPVPKRADYRERCLYYLEMCIALHNFACENELESKAELCAFLYDYEMTLIREEMEESASEDMPEVPTQAWILTGNMGEGEKNMSHGFWQASPLTQKGDLMLFYEKSPVMKLNSVWRAQEDGVVDPFFYYYSNTYIGNRIDIPEDKALTYKEFKDNEYFKVENRGKKGNYVSKNFQDVSGWEVTSADYKEIRRMLEAKGYDTSVLPNLFIPEALEDLEISDEHDVEEKLIVPTLSQMGWNQGVDYLRQVTLHLGREDKGRTDFSLFPYGDGQKKAKVVIEAKYSIKNKQEFEEAYEQAESYAVMQRATLFFVIDNKTIHPYVKLKDEYVKADCGVLRWSELYDNNDGTAFLQLKRLINSHK